MKNIDPFLVFQVLHLYIVLGLQDLLCLRLHAARVCDSGDRNCVRDHRVHLLPAQCRGLPVAVDQLPGSRLHLWICLLLFLLLLFLQDKVRFVVYFP
jgi:hypothetical protein